MGNTLKYHQRRFRKDDVANLRLSLYPFCGGFSLSVTGLSDDFTQLRYAFIIIRLQDCKCSSPVDEVRPISLLKFQRNSLQFCFGRGSLNGTHIGGIKQCSKFMVMFERFAFKMYCLAWFQKKNNPCFAGPKTTFFFSGKVALVDTSHEKFQDLYTAALTKELDLSTLDYLIVSHTEPDHSGSSIQGVLYRHFF